MRYAIYFAAKTEDPLMQLGNRWLGRNPETGAELRQPDVSGLSPERVGALTEGPRRYGFHGTLKAPFALPGGQDGDTLLTACAAFARQIAPFDTKPFGVNRLGKFLALTPSGPDTALSAFAALCVRHFEPFRAPLSGSDLERRRKSGLTERQDAYLTRWGYPYIFDEFRFHMTLSNKLENDSEADLLAAAAKEQFKTVTGRPRRCRSFAVYCEPEREAPFSVYRVFTLTGSTSPEDALEEAASADRKETA